MSTYPQYKPPAMNQTLLGNLERLNVNLTGSNGDVDDTNSVAYSSHSPLPGSLFYSPVDPELSSPFISQPDAQLFYNTSQDVYSQPDAQHFEINSQESSFLFPSEFTLDSNYLPSSDTTNDIRNDNHAIGDQFFNMIPEVQAHSPLIEVTAPETTLPGPMERDFITRTEAFVLLQPAADLKSVPLDLFTKIGNDEFNVQPPALQGHMSGVVAARYGIAVLGEDPDQVPPTEHELLDFLRQMLVKQNNLDGSQPQIIGVCALDRPLREEHMLMMLHRYSLRENRHYNLGIIRPLHQQPRNHSNTCTYTVSLGGPQTEGAKTVWVYEEDGVWHPVCPDNFKPAEKTSKFGATEKLYTNALGFPPFRARSVSNPAIQTANFLHPHYSSPYSPAQTQPYTPTESGYSDVSSYTTASQQTPSHFSDYHSRAASISFPCSSIANINLAVPPTSTPTPTLSGQGGRVVSPTSLTCTACGKTFTHLSELQHHFRNHKERKLSCQKCTRTFVWKKDLTRHEMTHLGPKGTRSDHTCVHKGCRKSYTRLDNLKRHMKNENHAER